MSDELLSGVHKVQRRITGIRSGQHIERGRAQHLYCCGGHAAFREWEQIQARVVITISIRQIRSEASEVAGCRVSDHAAVLDLEMHVRSPGVDTSCVLRITNAADALVLADHFTGSDSWPHTIHVPIQAEFSIGMSNDHGISKMVVVASQRARGASIAHGLRGIGGHEDSLYRAISCSVNGITGHATCSRWTEVDSGVVLAAQKGCGIVARTYDCRWINRPYECSGSSCRIAIAPGQNILRGDEPVIPSCEPHVCCGTADCTGKVDGETLEEM